MRLDGLHMGASWGDSHGTTWQFHMEHMERKNPQLYEKQASAVNLVTHVIDYVPRCFLYPKISGKLSTFGLADI